MAAIALSLDTAAAATACRVDTVNELAGRFPLAILLVVLMAFAPQPVAADEPQPIVSFHPAVSILPVKSYGPPFPAIEEPVMESDGAG